MPVVLIDGVEYVPKVEVPELTNERLYQCLASLTEIQYFNGQIHKHRCWAWEALNSLAPDLANLSSEEAYDLFHPDPHDSRMVRNDCILLKPG
ncbi:MAG: hypothetical protein SD837_22010 [Candidatus Electrothrix scaldis]|nr:MAG: hypothetical protein SD837_22010 [Candidatus Electrothrix sp. GW3-3]